VSGVCAQGLRDYKNYQGLNIEQEKLSLSNNIKFDMKLDEKDCLVAKELADKWSISDRIVLVAGSTHEPEEQALIDAFKQLSIDFPKLLLAIVPRHPQRFEKVASICQRSKLHFIKASENKACQADTQVLLIDQMGILRAAYALAKIAFVGGSISNRGGHNALEPAAFSVPILMGQHTYNNPAICEALMEVGALYSANDAQQIAERCRRWLDDEKKRLDDGLAGEKVLRENGGAIEATLKVLGLT